MIENPIEIKRELIAACNQQIDQRVADIQQRLDTITDSRNNATKSSVGDKYETSRAMMQTEEEKSKHQLAEAQKVKLNLIRLDWEKVHLQVLPGSLILSNKGIYFISIGLGKVKLANQIFFCVSLASPIGLAFRDKKEGDKFSFNGQQFEILKLY